MNGLDIVHSGRATKFVRIQDECQQGMAIPEMMEVAVIYINKFGRIFYHCSICSMTLPLSKNMESHMQDHFRHFPYRCHICPEQFDSLDPLIKHSNLHLSSKQKLEHTDPLQSTAMNSETMACDLKLSEGGEAIVKKEEPFDTVEKFQEDDYCSLDENPFSSEEEIFDNEVELHQKNKRKHVKKKVLINKTDPTKRYPCDVCKKSFVSKNNARIHMRVHTDEKPYKCLVCDKRFTHSSYINIHMRSHTGEKPYMCTLCGLTFKSQSSLTRHVKDHSRTRDFECDKCGKRFAKKEVLRTHTLTHSEQRPFACDICGRSFRRQNALRQHLKLHSDDKEYVCKICDNAFFQLAGLHNHMKTRHRALGFKSVSKNN